MLPPTELVTTIYHTIQSPSISISNHINNVLHVRESALQSAVAEHGSPAVLKAQLSKNKIKTLT